MSIDYNKKIIPLAKELRKSSTRYEKHLWYDFLATYPVRFQRQKTIGNFIVDFYCHQARLAIELDGSQHGEIDAMTYDSNRTEYLNSMGVYVLRFPNSDVDMHFKRVCQQIDFIVRQRLAADER